MNSPEDQFKSLQKAYLYGQIENAQLKLKIMDMESAMATMRAELDKAAVSVSAEAGSHVDKEF